MTFEEAKQQAIERSEWVLCHGAGYYTARTPDGRDIIGKGENGVFVGGEYRRVVVRVHKATESVEVYFGMNLFTNLSRRSATYNILSPSAKFKGYESRIFWS